MSSLFFYLMIVRRWRGQEMSKKKPVSLDQDTERSTSSSSAEEPPIGPTKVIIKVSGRHRQRRIKMITTGFTFPAQTATEDPDVTQVDVAFLSYEEEGEFNGNARLDSISYVTLHDLFTHEAAKRKKKADMGRDAYKHYKWYIRALKDELASLGPNKKFKIVHWLISSRNVNAFMIKSEFFPAISIIIAPKKEHWYAAYATEDGRSKYGTRNRITSGTSGHSPAPTYIRCRDDYCANNCRSCQTAKNCICFLHKRASTCIPTTIDEEEDLGDLV